MLDAPPYNVITLSCIITQPETVTVPKSIEWKRTSNGVFDTPAHNGENINTTSSDLSEPISTSWLIVSEEVAGLKLYSCCASSLVPVDEPVIYTESVEVTVKGEFCSIKLLTSLSHPKQVPKTLNSQ